MNSFFATQFNYCPLILMLHSPITNSKISSLHKRCLRKIYNDKISSFENLLEKIGLATVIFKAFKNIFLPIISNNFHKKE